MHQTCDVTIEITDDEAEELITALWARIIYLENTVRTPGLSKLKPHTLARACDSLAAARTVHQKLLTAAQPF